MTTRRWSDIRERHIEAAGARKVRALTSALVQGIAAGADHDDDHHG